MPTGGAKMVKNHITKKTLVAALMLSALTVQTAFAATMELNLDKAVHMALVNNSTIKISNAELANAKAVKDQAKGARWGSITASSSNKRGGYYHYVNGDGNGPSGTFKNGFTVDFPIYSGGALSGAIDKASKNYEYYKYGMDESYQATKLNATNGYYSVLEAANTVTLNKESVDQLAEHLKNTQAQFNVGVVAKIDVLRSQVELANAEQTLTKAKNTYDVAVATLNNIIGLPISTNLSVSEGLEYKPYNYTLDNCLTYAMTNRPEIHQAEASVALYKAAQKIANAGNMPTVGLEASTGWANNAWPATKNDQWAVGVTVSMNVWDYGVTAAKVAAAKADVVNAEETYRQTTDSVQLEVRTYYLSLREAEKRISTTSVAIAEAEEAYKIALVRYQAGVGTNTDVIDAQVSLTTAKNNYIQALYDYNTSHAKLEKAMGVPVLVD